MKKVEQDKIRNVAIIAHVDHGKTTLVDQLFRQSGMFRDNQHIEERLMDSMDIERERGITIKSKNGACWYKEYLINIIDTPGHADFGGEVERVLNMADGALFLVDAAEGPMPQSFFVLKKAIARNLPVIVVVNKIDKPAARCAWVVDQVFDLLVKLNAPDHILDFQTVYASAKDGYANEDDQTREGTIIPLFEKIIEKIPAPKGDPKGPLQLQISAISYSVFLGRLAIGKITSGSIAVNQTIVLATQERVIQNARITKLYHFDGNKHVETPQSQAGDIVAVAGIEDIRIGETITNPDNAMPLPMLAIDPPTIAMNFLPNDSPFSGREGQFVTSQNLKERLEKELLSDVALKVEALESDVGYKVSGRGELHLSILIERMRREGYEFQVSMPTVILKEENGRKLEPFEDLTIDVDEACMGKVIEGLGTRKGQLLELIQLNGMARLRYKIPTRGLLGYQTQFLSETRGMGVMNYIFWGYDDFAGDIKLRKNGVMVSKETGKTLAYDLFNLQDRGVLFLGPSEAVYRGQIIGEHCRENDLIVNPTKGKKLTNMRASGSDHGVILTPPLQMTLEQYIAYIKEGELVEVTPKSIRLRKCSDDDIRN